MLKCDCFSLFSPFYLLYPFWYILCVFTMRNGTEAMWRKIRFVQWEKCWPFLILFQINRLFFHSWFSQNIISLEKCNVLINIPWEWNELSRVYIVYQKSFQLSDLGGPFNSLCVSMSISTTNVANARANSVMCTYGRSYFCPRSQS